MNKQTCINPDCKLYHTDMTGPDGKSYIGYTTLEDGFEQPYCLWCGEYTDRMPSQKQLDNTEQA